MKSHFNRWLFSCISACIKSLTKIKFLLPLNVDISTIRLYLYCMTEHEALQEIQVLKAKIEELQKRLDAINETNNKKIKE